MVYKVFIAIGITGCVDATDSLNDSIWSNQANTSNSTTFRHIDSELGIVCYEVVKYDAVGISCLQVNKDGDASKTNTESADIIDEVKRVGN